MPTDYSETLPATGKIAERLANRRSLLSRDYELHMQRLIAEGNIKRHSLPDMLRRCLQTVRRQGLPHYFLRAPRWRMLCRTLSPRRVLPDFCVIGPPKSATSDLAVTLMSHPNILCPLVKECGIHDPDLWKPYYPTVTAVQRHASRHGTALCPCIAPVLHYLDIPLLLSRLRPNTKVIINLRNPVELVFSEWKWIVLHTGPQQSSKVPTLTDYSSFVDKALEIFPALLPPVGGALHLGIYWPAVAHWIRCFGAANVLVMDLASYFADPDHYFDLLQEHVGLPRVRLPTGRPATNRNLLDAAMPAPGANARLREFFEPYNEQLWKVLGRTYTW